MPELVSINSTFFPTLQTRLGIKPPPVNGFDLSTVVQPVSIVDSDISLVAQQSPIIPSAYYTTGELASPAAGVLLDTGAITTAGIYWFRVVFSFVETTNQVKVCVQHRNAGNTANVEEYRYYNQGNVVYNVDVQLVMTIQVNERVRIQTIANISAGFFDGTIQQKQLF